MTATPDLPTVERLDAISKRLGAVCDGEIRPVVYDVEEFLGEVQERRGGPVAILPTLEQLGALHAFRELLEMDRDDLASLIEEFTEKLLDLNLTRRDAAVQAGQTAAS